MAGQDDIGQPQHINRWLLACVAVVLFIFVLVSVMWLVTLVLRPLDAPLTPVPQAPKSNVPSY